MKVKRFRKNPIIKPEDYKGVTAIFNPGVVEYKNQILLYPRVIPKESYEIYSSRIGLMKSEDGFNFKVVKNYVIKPSESYDRGGCEDPRVTLFENKRLYLTYAALDKAPTQKHLPPRTVLVEVEDPFDEASYKKLGIITPPCSDNRDTVIFPEKIGKKLMILHRPHNWTKDCIKIKNGRTYVMYNEKFVLWPEELEEIKYFPSKPSIWIAKSKDLKEWYDFKVVLESKYEWENVKVGAGAPPIKTEEGWLCIYHGVGYLKGERHYSVGAFLLDLDNPEKVIGRTKKPIWFPEKEYEKRGDVNNVIFPTGVVKRGNKLLIYAGLADKYIGVATISEKKLLREMLS